LISNNVWICNKAIILKGSQINSHSIIASGAIVTDQFDESNVIIGGSPARILKHQIFWKE